MVLEVDDAAIEAEVERMNADEPYVLVEVDEAAAPGRCVLFSEIAITLGQETLWRDERFFVELFEEESLLQRPR